MYQMLTWLLKGVHDLNQPKRGYEDDNSSRENPKWWKGRHHESHACGKKRNQWIYKYKNMKLKELKCKYGMREDD